MSVRAPSPSRHVTGAAAARGASSKAYFTGTHRTCAPERTWERIRPLLPRLGITRVADITGLDVLGVPVYQSMRPASRNLSVSQGKGLTPAAARVSAVMESVEMWHAECLDRVPQVTSSLREMRYGNPIPHETFRWMRGTRAFDALPIRWVEATSLVSGRRGWVPRDMIELDFRARELFEPDMFVRNSNGLASGNTPHEATLHGLCELIERHAWRLAQIDPERLVRIDEASLPPGPLVELIDRVRRAGVKLALYDFTWDVGVPAAFARIVAPDLPVVWNGAGCHTSAEVAVSRAFTEAAQSRLTLIAGARDDLVGLAKGARPRRSFETFSEPPPGRAFASLPDLSSGSVAEDVDRVVARLAELGYEPFRVDLTHPGVGVPVALALVPGLKEMHA